MSKKLLILLLFLTACGRTTHVTQVSPKPCTVESTPTGALISCPDGSKTPLYNGDKGDLGSKGDKGDAGTNASPCSVTQTQAGAIVSCPDGSTANITNGVDTTPITLVKFCNDTPSYPSTFPEYGLCISDTLYAVYSSNGGFLALIPPGTYSSNGIGSSCTFTVSSGCQITR